MLAVHRADLHEVLRQALPETVLHTDAEVISASADGKMVCRRSGEEQELAADLVIAADGVNSVIRRSLWGGGPVFQHRAVWRGVTPSGSVWPVVDCMTLGRGQQVGMLPLPDERVYWFAMVNAERPNQVYADERAEVLRLVSGWHDPIRALVEATPAEQVLHNDIVDIDPVDTFVRGRVVLLGDAAHAMSPNLGQGACQAIEDAVVLASELAATSGPPQRAAAEGPAAAEGSAQAAAADGPAGAERPIDSAVTEVPAGLDAALGRYDVARRARTQPMAAAARKSIARTADTSAVAHLALSLTARLAPPAAWRKVIGRWSDWTPPSY